jgi:hypothetical protein
MHGVYKKAIMSCLWIVSFLISRETVCTIAWVLSPRGGAHTIVGETQATREAIGHVTVPSKFLETGTKPQTGENSQLRRQSRITLQARSAAPL